MKKISLYQSIPLIMLLCSTSAMSTITKTYNGSTYTNTENSVVISSTDNELLYSINDTARVNNLDIPSLNIPIAMQFNSISLYDLFAVLTEYSEVNIVTSKDVNLQARVTVDHPQVTKVTTILSEVFSQYNLTYKSLGNNVVFIYPNTASNHCVYDASTVTTDSSSTSVSAESYSLNSSDSLDSSNEISIKTNDLNLSNTFKYLEQITGREFYIDSNILPAETTANYTSYADMTDLLSLTDVNLNQILTLISYRNGLDFRYADSNTVLISQNREIKQCR